MDSERIGQQVIFYEDARRLSELVDTEGQVDVIVTSPPYNIGKTYKGDKGKVYNDSLDTFDYISLMRDVFRQSFDALADHGVFFLNVGDTAKVPSKSYDALRIATNSGFTHLQTVVWVKSILGRGHYTPSGGTRRFDNVWESIHILVKDRKKYRLDTKLIGVPYADKSNVGRYGKTDCKDPGNVWLIPYEKTTGQSVKKVHVAPFPVGLPYKCIKAVPGAKTVLDPFAGLGTTLAAAELLGIKGYGFELYPLKDRIRKRIKHSVAPSEQLLIPHLESAIRTLTTVDLSKKPTTKKAAAELAILRDVCRVLSLPDPVIN